MAEGARNWLPSGYDEDFVNAVEDEILCSICYLPLKEPVLTRCGHRFCKECLEEHFRRQEAQDQPLTCPADREGLDRDRDVFPDKATERKILSLAIKCPSEGCDWTGELRSKEVHLAFCLFKLVTCTNENCDVAVQRRHLKEHLAITCQWRILECIYCTEPHPECKMQDHVEQCSKFPLSCPNSCGVSIPRELVPNHTEFDCPLTIISCSYEKIGCETKVQRVQVDSHLQSAMRLHLDLACVKLTNTEAKLNDTEAELNNTKTKLNNTDAKLNDAHVKLNETQEKLNVTEEKLEATRKVVEKLETRMFTWRINKFSEILRQAKIGVKPTTESDPFYTDKTGSYGYKLKALIYPNGLENFSGRLVVAIAVMKGEYDAILPWPFKSKVKMTLYDQQVDPLKRENITGTPIRQNGFPRPVTGLPPPLECVLAISLERLHSRRYLKDDTLFLQFEIRPL